jgi:hypothetical protein
VIASQKKVAKCCPAHSHAHGSPIKRQTAAGPFVAPGARHLQPRTGGCGRSGSIPRNGLSGKAGRTYSVLLTPHDRHDRYSLCSGSVRAVRIRLAAAMVSAIEAVSVLVAHAARLWATLRAS